MADVPSTMSNVHRPKADDDDGDGELLVTGVGPFILTSFVAWLLSLLTTCSGASDEKDSGDDLKSLLYGKFQSGLRAAKGRFRK